MIRSGSARTARPTSRSSISLRCGRSRTCSCFRPCDTVETVECWQLALRNAHAAQRARPDPPEPAAAARRIRRRQPLRRRRLRDRCPPRRRTPRSRCSRPDSEVAIAVEARKLLPRAASPRGWCRCPASSCSSPPPAAERQRVVGTAPVRVAVEAAVRQGWDAVIGSDGAFVGMTGSAPAAATRTSTAISALPPSTSPRRRSPSWPRAEILHWTCAFICYQRRQIEHPVARRRAQGRRRYKPERRMHEMSVRVAINGFGRIGRNVLRAIVESGRKDIEVVAHQRSRAGRDQRPSAALRFHPRPLSRRGQGRRRHASIAAPARSR